MQRRAASGLITVQQCTSVLSGEERVGIRSQGRQGDGNVEQQQTKQPILLIRGAVVWRGNVIIISAYMWECAFVFEQVFF